MPLQEPTRLSRSLKPALDLPPPFRLLTLREVGDAFAHATRVAAQEGAGTLVHVGRFDLVEFAVVLEPDEPLKTARRSLYAGVAALGGARGRRVRRSRFGKARGKLCPPFHGGGRRLAGTRIQRCREELSRQAFTRERRAP